VEAEVPDQRDLTDTDVKVHVRTTDDLGVRPSDHNFVLATLAVDRHPGVPEAPRH
jgi:hypothetical protein